MVKNMERERSRVKLEVKCPKYKKQWKTGNRKRKIDLENKNERQVIKTEGKKEQE